MEPKPKPYYHSLPILFLLLLPVLSTAAAECTCEDEDLEEDPKSITLKYRVGSIFALLAASTAGVLLPIFGERFRGLRPETDTFFMVKSFAAGVIIATAFIHILPDAFESLTSPCLKGAAWENFPFTGFVAMLGALGTLMIDSMATGYYRRVHNKRPKHNNIGAVEEEIMRGISTTSGGGGDQDQHTHASHAHIHAAGGVKGAGGREEWATKLSLIRHRVTSQVLELGIMVHSVIIGITLGVSGSLATIKTLMAALCCHQFFEGMGLGGCIVLAKFNARAMVVMAIFFAITTPLGVAIGIGISNVYSESSPTSLIVQGILEAAAAGVLIYMALVDLLAADFMHDRVQDNPMLQLGCNISLLLGAGCMSVLAKWA